MPLIYAMQNGSDEDKAIIRIRNSIEGGLDQLDRITVIIHVNRCIAYTRRRKPGRLQTSQCCKSLDILPATEDTDRP